MQKNNVILSRVCRRFEKKPIQIKYSNTIINQQISNMLKDSNHKLTYYEHMMMECCLLFLCGYSFLEISNITHTYDRAVIKFLNSDKLLELLSDEYLILFENNKYRLEVDVYKNEIIKKAIVTYVEQDGNIAKTCNVLNIYPTQFREYVLNPDLERIISDSDLYYKYLLLRGVKNKKFNVESDREKYLNVVKELVELKPSSDEEQIYLNLAKAILIKELNSINQIVDCMGLSRESAIYYLKRFSQCKTFFSRRVMSMILLKSMFILNKYRTVFSYDEFVQLVISTYMNSRYTVDDIADIFYLEKQEVEYIIYEKSKEIMKDFEYQNLIDHGVKLVLIEQDCPFEHCIVKDPRIISILNRDVIYVSEQQYDVLDVLVNYLKTGEQLYYHDVKQILFSDIEYLYSNIDLCEKIFISDSFQQIKRNLEIEYLLNGNNIKDKKQYVWSVMKQFLRCNADLEFVSDSLNIEISTLIRILQDPSISAYYGSVLAKYIQGAIEDYRMRYKKKSGNQNDVYTKIKVLEEDKKKQV